MAGPTLGPERFALDPRTLTCKVTKGVRSATRNTPTATDHAASHSSWTRRSMAVQQCEVWQRLVWRLRQRGNFVGTRILRDVGGLAGFDDVTNALRRHDFGMNAPMTVRNGVQVGVVALAMAAVTLACSRGTPPTTSDGADLKEAGGAESGDMDSGPHNDGAPALQYHAGCSYCPVPCYPEPKTCDERGIHINDPCWVAGVVNTRMIGNAPTESCVYSRYSRTEHDAGDGGDGGCTVRETFLTCLPDSGRNNGGPEDPLSCGGGGVPCPEH